MMIGCVQCNKEEERGEWRFQEREKQERVEFLWTSQERRKSKRERERGGEGNAKHERTSASS